MKKVIFAVLAVVTTASFAGPFKCVDAGGRTTYSDQPCPGGKELHINSNQNSIDNTGYKQQRFREAREAEAAAETARNQAAAAAAVAAAAPVVQERKKPTRCVGSAFTNNYGNIGITNGYMTCR
nr:DUF4124 domain-containing protein [uncultured Pseudogulbenkiania sp.]